MRKCVQEFMESIRKQPYTVKALVFSSSAILYNMVSFYLKVPEKQPAIPETKFANAQVKLDFFFFLLIPLLPPSPTPLTSIIAFSLKQILETALNAIKLHLYQILRPTTFVFLARSCMTIFKLFSPLVSFQREEKLGRRGEWRR